MDKIIEVRNLEVYFSIHGKSMRAIRGVDFDLERGKTLAIVGESGCGKSITVKSLLGIKCRNQRVSGDIKLFNDPENTSKFLDIMKMKKKDVIRNVCGKQIAMIFQDPMTTLDPTMTIGRQISEVIKRNSNVKRSDVKAKVYELLEEVGIDNPDKRYRQYPHQLSGGMRQRVVIAIALACEPKVLICDEPTTALDVTIQEKILDLIKEVQKRRNLAVVYITHDLGVVAKVADTVAVMYAGKIIEQGGSEDIFYDARHPYTKALLSSVPKIGDTRDRLYNIPGTPPNLLSEIKGDAFASRNPNALEIDYEVEPPRFDISETHFVYSWLEDPRAERVFSAKAV